MHTKIRIFINLVIASIFVCHAGLSVVSAAKELYTPEDDVVLLNSTTFLPTVFQPRNISFVVEFYNTFCGHCQAFAPIYKEIASRTKNWTSVVEITALDCAKDENIQTCIDNKVSGYPTILLYPPNARINDPKYAPLDLRSLNKPWTVDDIEENIIDYVANQTYSGRTHSLASDALQPTTVADPIYLKRIYNQPEFSDGLEADSKHQELMIVIEDEKSYLGRKIILQYYRIHSRVEIRRVTLDNKPFLRRVLDGKTFDNIEETQPLLIRLSDDGLGGFKVDNLVHGDAKHALSDSDASERADFVFNRFKNFLDHYYSVELTEISPASSIRTESKKEAHPETTYDDKLLDPSERAEVIQRLVYYFEASNRTVFATDLLHAIVYIVTHEVPIKGDLTPGEYNTVRNLLTILLKYLPLDSWDAQLHKLLLDLRTHLDKERTTYEKSGVRAKQMLDLLELSGSKSLSERYEKTQWVSCIKSEIQQKGYTCAVWLLFHTLTVGEFVKAAPVRANPSLVLFTMRDYITHFFGCTVCAINFQKETESLENSLTYRNSSVLWLWSTHNSVRQRLNSERLVGKKTLSEVLYPLFKSCPSCFKTEFRDIDFDRTTLGDIQWDLKIVFNHLVSLYRPDRVISPATMETYQAKVIRDMHSEVIESLDANRSSGQSSIFSTSDISLCLFLYLTCIIIVAIVCVSMNPKLKHMKIV